jgi:uncharacterized protein (PEP-CTERM system associated)
MAITTDGGAPAARRRSAGKTRSEAALRAIAIAVMGLSGGLASAQAVKGEFSVGSNLTATDNVDLTTNDEARSDLILNVTPQLDFSTNGARFKARGTVGLSLTHHLQGEQRDRILPAVSGSLNAALVERWLFLDASADLTTIESNAFGVRPSERSTTNRRVAEAYRVSPYIERELSRELSLLARADTQWTRLPSDELNGSTDVQSQNVHVQRNTLTLEHKPVPLGGAVELSSQKTRYKDDTDALLQVEGARAVVSAAVGGDTVVSAVAGRERSRFTFSEERDDVFGLRLRWVPSPRTELKAAIEDRFFGKGVDVSLTHRNPQVSVSLELTRGPVIEPVFLGVAPRGTDLAAYLDQILTTRIADPVARRDAVRDLLESRGLPDTLTRPISVVAQYAQIQETVNATLVLLGRRNTLSLTVFTARLERLVRPGDPDIGTADQDNQQVGGDILYNRRLSPLTAAELGMSWSNIKGLADRKGDRTRQLNYRFGLTRRLGLRTDLSIGVLRQEATLSTESGSDSSIDESSAFVGLSHRF